MMAGRKPRRVDAGAACRLAVELEQRRETRRLSADDGKRQRQAELGDLRAELRDRLGDPQPHEVAVPPEAGETHGWRL